MVTVLGVALAAGLPLRQAVEVDELRGRGRRRQTRHCDRVALGTVGLRSMIVVVMGAAGFIGANLVKNERGDAHILAVDNIARSEKFRNVRDSEWSGPDRGTVPVRS